MSAPDLIAGIAMQQGTRIHLCIVGANRCRAQFPDPDPDRLDLARTEPPPRIVSQHENVLRAAPFHLARWDCPSLAELMAST